MTEAPEPRAIPNHLAAQNFDCEVAIVGAGISGLALASALGGAGLDLALVDRGDLASLARPDRDGRTTAIAAGSKRVLEAIGAWASMAPDAEPILEIRVSDGESLLFLHYDHAELRAGPLGWIVENATIRRALGERLAALSSVRTMTGSVAALARDEHGIELALEDGRRIRASLVVAADGKDSSLRRIAGIGATEWRYDQTSLVCTVAHERAHRGIAHERFLQAGPFAILPMTGNRSSIVWTERADLVPALLALGAEAFAAELATRFGDFLGALAIEGRVFAYPLALMHADAYVAARLALVGDAAHAIHPIAGQGLNLGLRDVAALAQSVVDAHRIGLDLGAAEPLARYERWRRFDNALMIAMTDGLNRLFSTGAAPARFARDAGLALVDRLAPAKRALMRQAMGIAGDAPRLVRGEAL
ncbi:MAG TPA: UbiH/UbiF/VisC/COQ6 family ubiquinone biosynthesis hydroxylase [Alphaproteobacteria bacterium]